MFLFDDITSALPAPRDDEPPELRARIAKELRDHLECAYQRELLLAGNEAEATRRVLDRFGDPAQIARRLWFDALWENIMSQRVLVGMCAVMTAACIGMGLFNWRTAADSAEVVRRLIEHSDTANRTLIEQSRDMNRLILEQSRDSNQALLKKMGDLVAMSGAQQSPEWVPVKIRLVLDEPGGRPAAGYDVAVSNSHSLSLEKPAGGRITIDEKSNDDGLLDCGRLRSGNYSVSVTTPWNELCEHSFYVRAGLSEQLETIYCPSAEEPSSVVNFDFDLPDDLRSRSLGVICEFSYDGRELRGFHWRRQRVAELFPNIVTSKGGIWNSYGIEYMPQWTPPGATLHYKQPVDAIRRVVGKHGLRIRGIILLPEDRPPRSIEQVRWFPTSNTERGIFSEFTTSAIGENRVKISIPEQLYDEVRRAFVQKTETDKTGDEKPAN
jgi:hypothetical protein